VRGRILAAPFQPEMLDLTPSVAPTADDVVEAVAELVRREPPFLHRDPREVRALIEVELGLERTGDLLGLLRSMARELFTERDGLPALRVHLPHGAEPEQVPDQLELWRALVERMDPTPLLAASLVRHAVAETHSSVILEQPISVGDQVLRQVLAPGVVETHLHLATSHSFRAFFRRFLDPRDRLWRELGRRLRGRRVPRLDWDLVRVLGLLLLIRLCLERRLWPEAFPPASRNEDLERWDEVLQRCLVRVNGRAGASFREALMAVPETAVFELRSLRYTYLFGSFAPGGDLRTGEGATADFPFARGRVNETVFFMGLFRSLEDPACEWGPQDRRLFLTYVRLKNAAYRAMVMDSDRPGFAAFKQRFSVMKALELDGVRALLAASSDPLLERLEVRMNPGGKSKGRLALELAQLLEVQQQLLLGGDVRCSLVSECPYATPDTIATRCDRGFPAQGGARDAPSGGPARAPHRTPCGRAVAARARVTQSGSDQALLQTRGHLTRIGIILHFLKPEEPPRHREGSSLYALLAPNARRALATAAAVRELMDERGESRHACSPATLADYLVGVDVANVETALPNFVFLPAFRYLRGAWRLGGRQRRRQSLGFTFHCGEDFFDMVSGLRTIEEVVEEFRFLPGDRLGHALVAGLDPEWWCRQREPVMVPLEEEIWNRLWIWRLARDGHVTFTRLSSLESWLTAKGQEWLGMRDVLPAHLLQLWRCRYEAFVGLVLAEDSVRSTLCSFDDWRRELERHRRRAGEREIPCPELAIQGRPLAGGAGFSSIVGEALFRYFHDAGVARRGRENRVRVRRSPDEVRLISELQRYVCRLLAQRGLFVEVNLTSNCIIAGIEDVSHHPIYRWKLPGEDLATGFRVSLNTDNASLFGTRLETEYALLFDGARRRGVGRVEARELVETIRRESAAASFVRRRYASREQELMGLCAVISKLRG